MLIYVLTKVGSVPSEAETLPSGFELIVGLNMLRARCLKFISMKSRCLKTAPNGAAALFAVERPEAGSMAQNWQV